MVSSKILPFEMARDVFDTLRTKGTIIVQSHGTFDLIHPGHIDHLERARALGDALVVTVTGLQFVNKGPGRPYFNDQVRAKMLAALACVDYVVIVPYAGAVEAIECIRPHVYCKGREYEHAKQENEDFIHDLKTIERIGGRVCYTGPGEFSSTKLLNRYFDHVGGPIKEFCHQLSIEVSPKAFREVVDSFRDLRVLVIGDTIFDRYSFLKVQGLTSKNSIISGRYLGEEMQGGGALAVFRHVKQFTPHIKFLSLVGTESWATKALADYVSPHEDATLREEGFTTIIKQRFVEPVGEGKELSKLFAVNYIDADPPNEAVQERVRLAIASEIERADLVMLLDFGHGLAQPIIRQFIQEHAPFLALNCQTNSNNYGFNIISRQYRRADAFSLDQQEIMLASGHRHLDFRTELESLRHTLKSRYAWLTRGEVETIGQLENHPDCFCPPLENSVVDTIGAGDAFFSLASLAAGKRLPINLATFLGQLAGAQAVKIVGNSTPISKQVLISSGCSLLTF